MSVHMIEAKFLLLEVSTTTLSPSIWHMKSVHITEAKVLVLEITTTTLIPSFWHHKVSTHFWAKILLLEVSTTTLSPSIWHMKSVPITEAKVLLLEVSTTTLSPSIWHQGVSTHGWGKVFTAGGVYYYIESQYLTHEVITLPEAKFLLLEVSTTTLSPSIWHM